MVLLYDRILRHRQIPANKSDMTWNWSFNMPCKSLKGILNDQKGVLNWFCLKESSHTHETRASFTILDKEKVYVIVEGKLNQLYAQRMRSFEQYDETRKNFTEGKQKDNNGNEVQIHLQLYNVSLGEYLTNKYALWLNFRMIDENVLHGMGRRIKNALEGITLQIEKKRKQLGLSMLTYT